ncbi:MULTISPECIES: hypothetical protein [Rhizobium/Agrobacterium group]|uniref:Uncharacterized protein n=1 Tax=Agrobacterium arsenijevicii TaxID=1585697 RepID=A0ABR5D3L1_9HYPH|nr:MULTISPECIES: hypothetical protein [unclassified Rhizobium]KJF71658.1 hypothetical protein RP75_19140 [Agrobacterium arsenijevicii]MDH7804882.1 hypothetical protein [Rhizobium sp. AN70]
MKTAPTDYPEDILTTAWFVTAKHQCRGEKDTIKIVADAIWQERLRWINGEANLGDQSENSPSNGETLAGLSISAGAD